VNTIRDEHAAERAVAREAALREILLGACRRLQWGSDGAALPSRLTAALTAYRLDVEAEGFSLSAGVTADLGLAVQVSLAAEFDAAIEGALRATLEESTSPVARLLLAEWGGFCDACRAAATRPPEAEIAARNAPRGRC
jgi:hypothetical protein